MSKLISLSDISGLADNSWVNGSFKAIVTNSKSPSGKSPGKAVLVIPTTLPSPWMPTSGVAIRLIWTARSSPSLGLV